jgi:hypothetical protein
MQRQNLTESEAVPSRRKLNFCQLPASDLANPAGDAASSVTARKIAETFAAHAL